MRNTKIRTIIPSRLRRFFDAILLFCAAALFGASLTAKLKTGAYGLAIPTAPYQYESSDFLMEAAGAAAVAFLALWVIERRKRWRDSSFARHAAFSMAALVAAYLGPPQATVFGNTWAQWEPTRELFLAQMDLVLPVVAVVTLVRALMHRVLWRAAE